MKYTLDTLPVLDVYRTDCECPLCRLKLQCEDQYVNTLLASAYMEPEWRMQTNRTGFCQRHFEQMFARRNRLGLALMTHTHMQEVIASLQALLQEKPAARKSLLSSLRGAGRAEADGVPARIRARISGCALCEQVDASLKRYAYTIAQLYVTNSEFRAMFAASKGFCLPHLALLLEMAEETLNGSQLSSFHQGVAALEMDSLHRIEGELEWFTLKFDYRNDAKPWGNSKDAPERAINKLMGVCVGEEAHLPSQDE